MKVIIELNEDMALDNVDGNPGQVRIIIGDKYAIVRIDDLKLALRKLSAR